jgi:hypothetical protein
LERNIQEKRGRKRLKTNQKSKRLKQNNKRLCKCNGCEEKKKEDLKKHHQQKKKCLYFFDVFSFTICNVSHVIAHHLPLIIQCLLLLLSPTTIPFFSDFHVLLVFFISLQLHTIESNLVPFLVEFDKFYFLRLEIDTHFSI